MAKLKDYFNIKEYIGGGRIGTLKTSYRDLVDKMDQLEQSGKVIVRELPGPSGDGKTNREFEVVDRDSAVAGGNKQERGFTVYDYKFGFDPGSIDNYEEEYDFSVGGNDLRLAMELIPDVVPYRLEENVVDNVIESSKIKEDSVNEAEIAPTGIGISQKQIDDLIKLGAISGLEVFVRDKDGSNVRKIEYTLTNTDFEKDPERIDIDYVDEINEDSGHDWLKRHAGLK